ncbi:unnamed protein product [Closterium sp. NIES-53]
MALPMDGDAAGDEPDDIEGEIAHTGLDLLMCSLSKATNPRRSKNHTDTTPTTIPTVTSAPPDSIGATVLDNTTPRTNGEEDRPMTVYFSPSTPAEASPTSPIIPPPSASRPDPAASQRPPPDVASPASRIVPPASHPPAAASASPACRLVQSKLNFIRDKSAPSAAPTDVPLLPVPEAAASNQPLATADEIYAVALDRFKSRWQGQFVWLQLVKTATGLPAFKCSLCLEHAGLSGKTGKGSEGAVDVQKQAFTRHAATNKHKLAIQRQDQLVGVTRQPRIDEHPLAHDSEKVRVISLLDALLFVSKEDAPMELWVGLVRYLAERGVPGFPKKGYGTYYTTYGFGELTQSIATWLQTTQLEKILASPYIGISCDESTDRCRGKHLILLITFIRDHRLVNEFMALLTVEKADAASLLQLLLSHVQACGVDLRRIVGISTDGASVMMGSRSGLVARLRLRIPHLVSCHCIAHREALAAKDAADSMPVFGMIDSTIRAIAEHLGRSGPWHQRFMDLQEVFSQTFLELQGIHNVRWLSRGDAIARFVAVLPAVITMLKEWNEELYTVVTSYRFHFLLLFLSDVLDQMNVLSRTFQRREVRFCGHAE